MVDIILHLIFIIHNVAFIFFSFSSTVSVLLFFVMFTLQVLTYGLHILQIGVYQDMKKVYKVYDK